MDFVLGLPAQGFARRSSGHAEQDATVPFEAAGAELGDRAKELRTDAVVLRPARIVAVKAAWLTISLEARLDRSAEIEARLPRVYERRPRCGVIADVFFHEQVDRVDCAENLLAEDRPEGGLVGSLRQGGLAELGEKPGIGPIFAAWGELKDVFRGDLAEIDRLAGAGGAFLLELEFGAPEAIDPIFEFFGKAGFVAMSAQRVVTDIAERLDRDFAGFGVRVDDPEISRGRTSRGEAEGSAGDKRQ